MAVEAAQAARNVALEEAQAARALAAELQVLHMLLAPLSICRLTLATLLHGV